jgi:TPR repeat protein
MAILMLCLAYFAVGLIWFYRNRLKAPEYQIYAAPVLIILTWPIALFFEIKKLWSTKRFRVGFAAYDPDQPERMEIPEYKFFASWSDAVHCARFLARSSKSKVTIYDEARYDKGISGFVPRWVTVAPGGGVILASSSQIRQEYLNAAAVLCPVSREALDLINTKWAQPFVEGDYATALRELRSAADAGDPSAMNCLGVMFNEGIGVPVDHREAALYFLKGAEGGDHRAQFTLGCMYRDGIGVARNLHETIRWWKKAAQQGDSMAQYNLGLMYTQGEGVREDPLEARRWIEKAAEQGETRAFYNLGLLYLAEPKDYVKAHMWLNLAVMNGVNEKAAIQRRDGLRSVMTFDQIMEAEKLAREWTPIENKYYSIP